MENRNKIYRFSGQLQRKSGLGAWYYVIIPLDVEKEFGTKGIVRVLGTYNNLPFDRALIPLGNGTHHIVFSGEMRKKAGLKLGNMVSVEFYINEHPEDLLIPAELEEGFELEPDAKVVFERQTQGFKRNVLLWINQAKLAETKAKRVAEILRRLTSNNQMFGGTKLK